MERSCAAKPMATAGFSAPPEMAPPARPPAVTQEPIARAKGKLWRVVSCDAGGLVVATASTTYASTKVKNISTVPALAAEKSPTGRTWNSTLLLGPASWKMVQSKPATVPARHWATMYDAPSAGLHFPRPLSMIATVTAGLKCAPETLPKE